MTAGDYMFPASFPQRRLWFLEQLQPGTSLYNVAAAARLLGALDPAAVRAALETIVGRHESLRTTFLVSGTEPLQVIGPPGPLGLPVVDLEPIPAALRQAEADRLAQAVVDEPFDLARGPLFRARLFRLTPEEHVLVLAMHHIVSDGWSLGVLLRELSAFYRAYSTGEPPQQPSPSCQYRDFVIPNLRHPASPADLRVAMRACMPDYMVPANIVLVGELPLTPSGKVDRQALPPPTDAPEGDEIVDPRTELERQLAGIWREVLRRERVGVHDDFFSLGGHSLLATQVIARMRLALELNDLSVEMLFEAPTVAQLAERITALRRGPEEPAVPPLGRVNRSAYRLPQPRPSAHVQPTEQA